MTDGKVQVVLLEPPDALSEEAAVKTCWKRCTAKQSSLVWVWGLYFALGFVSGGI